MAGKDRDIVVFAVLGIGSGLAMALAAWLLLAPPVGPPPVIPFQDKLLHALVFAALTGPGVLVLPRKYLWFWIAHMAALGAGIEAIVRVRVPHGSTDRFRRHVVERPEVLHCDHVTGDDCMVARVRTTSMARLEEIVGAVGTFGATTTSLVFSSEVRDRPFARDVVDPADDRDEAAG